MVEIYGSKRKDFISGERLWKRDSSGPYSNLLKTPNVE